MRPIRLATRGSPLALWQAEQVKKSLLAARPEAEIELVLVRTVGDRNTRTDLSLLLKTGIFTKEVDREILEHRADLGVHSLKDQETRLAEGLDLGLVLPRGPVEDVLIARAGQRFADLPPGARVATGSLRRRAQLLRLRDDIEVVGIRGNVDDRLRKLDEGVADALVMARAGIERLGLGERITEIFATETMLPAPSQGIVGVTCRADDAALRELLLEVDDAVTHAVALAERALLATLEGGCNIPVGALAETDGEQLEIRARVLQVDGAHEVSGERQGALHEAAQVGRALALDLLARGAADLIREIRA